MNNELKSEILKFEGALRDRVQQKILLRDAQGSKKKAGYRVWIFIIVFVVLGMCFSYGYLYYMEFFPRNIHVEKVLRFAGLSENPPDLKTTDHSMSGSAGFISDDFYCFDRNGLPDRRATDQANLMGSWDSCEKVLYEGKLYSMKDLKNENSMLQDSNTLNVSESINDLYCFDRNGLPDRRATDQVFLDGNFEFCDKIFFENKMYIFDNLNGLFVDENGLSNSRLREFYLEKTEEVGETVK